MIPVITHVVERVLLSSESKIGMLVLKCDGMDANKGVPDKIRNILKEKYPLHEIHSENGKFVYNLNHIELKVNFCFNCILLLRDCIFF